PEAFTAQLNQTMAALQPSALQAAMQAHVEAARYVQAAAPSAFAARPASAEASQARPSVPTSLGRASAPGMPQEPPSAPSESMLLNLSKEFEIRKAQARLDEANQAMQMNSRPTARNDAIYAQNDIDRLRAGYSKP